MSSVENFLYKIKLFLQRFKRRDISLFDTLLSFKLIIIYVLIIVFWCFMEIEFCHMDYFFNPYFLAINDLLKSNDVNAFLFYGPLLGIMRSQKLMDWDYDLDFAIYVNQTKKLLSLRNKFENMGLEVYGRNEFIWHKFGGNLFKINSPILRIYTRPSPLFRYHIEFYEFHDETVKSAKQNGHRINDLLSSFNDDVILLCINPEEPCFEKNKMFPLQISNQNMFGVDFKIPKDPEYCLRNLFGPNWKTPIIKGWKSIICYQQWDRQNIATMKCIIFLLFIILIILCCYQRYKNKNKNNHNINQDPTEKEYLMIGQDQSSNDKHN